MRILCLFLALIGTANAEPWDTTDKVLGITSTTLLIVDWGQTRYIAKHPELYQENNVILGKHPSVGRVNAYFGTVIVGNLLLADWLSTRNRKLWLGTVTAVELVVTAHNRNIGIKLSF
jgi:hypothetical protein